TSRQVGSAIVPKATRPNMAGSSSSVRNSVAVNCSYSAEFIATEYPRYVRHFWVPVPCHLSLDPTPHPRAILIVLALKVLFQPGFLDRNYSPVEVGNRERQKKNWPHLFQQSCLSQIGQDKAQIHWISGEAIRSPGHQQRR